MGVNCEIVWRESSNYIDGAVSDELRLSIDEHVQTCAKCASVLDGLKNIVQLYGDERMSEVPLGYGQRLHRKLEEDMVVPARRGFLKWGLAFAASVAVVGAFEGTKLYRENAALEKYKKIPLELEVLMLPNDKIFHVQGCSIIRNRSTIALTAREAIKAGDIPCQYCLRKYLQS
jgi:hypothetical protein